MKYLPAILAGLLLVPVSSPGIELSLEQAFPNLTFVRPVDLQDPRDGTNRLFVVEQRGVVWVFENDPAVAVKDTFLDIRDRVDDLRNEEGLLGLAFHPDYADSGYFYVNYTASPAPRTVVARYSVSPSNPDSAVYDSEFVLLEVAQPFDNHNGGQLAFGPDGFLYIGMGDGGSSGDPQGNGQNLTTLLGALLRVDVDTTTASANYGIPTDNPFAGNVQGYREEIYAYGLRNPWRFSFDPVSNRLWLGDVGQNAYEEVDLVRSGKNYGWNVMEGFHCYPPSAVCDTIGLEPPIWEYPHTEGHSITGGYVYRGARNPDIVGEYIYADYVLGKIWALDYDGVNPPANTLLTDTTLSISSFGIDRNGEVYMCAFDGRIYRFEASATPVSLQGYRSYWAADHVEVAWRLYQSGPNVSFDLYRLEGSQASFVRIAAPTVLRIADEYVFQDHIAGPGLTYRYRVVILEGGEAVTSFETTVVTPRTKTSLGQNYPNPFNPTTAITYRLDAPSDVSLAVYDASGRLVRVLVEGRRQARRYVARWDGRDRNGAAVPSGVYFFRLTVGKNVLTRKGVLLK